MKRKTECEVVEVTALSLVYSFLAQPQDVLSSTFCSGEDCDVSSSDRVPLMRIQADDRAQNVKADSTKLAKSDSVVQNEKQLVTFLAEQLISGATTRMADQLFCDGAHTNQMLPCVLTTTRVGRRACASCFFSAAYAGES